MPTRRKQPVAPLLFQGSDVVVVGGDAYVSLQPDFLARWYAADVPATPPPTMTQRALAGRFLAAAAIVTDSNFD